MCLVLICIHAVDAAVDGLLLLLLLHDDASLDQPAADRHNRASRRWVQTPVLYALHISALFKRRVCAKQAVMQRVQL